MLDFILYVVLNNLDIPMDMTNRYSIILNSNINFGDIISANYQFELNLQFHFSIYAK